MCFDCTRAWCSTCAEPALFLVVANGPTTVVVLRACRRHVDCARLEAGRTAGVRPNITAIPQQREATR